MKEITEPILKTSESAFICIDLQERILPAMCYEEAVIKNSNILINAAGILKIPFIVTEQYPKGLGKTDKRIILNKTIPIFEKTNFSVFGCKEFVDYLSELKNIRNLIVFGIETHVCIYQSVYHALKQGYRVYLVSDAVSSRHEHNNTIGINMLSSAGAKIISTEVAIFQHIASSSESVFKNLSSLIK